MKSTAFENVICALKLELENTQAARVIQSGRIPQDEKKHELEGRVAREFLERKEVDAACLHWIETGNWPKPKHHPDVILHYWDRLFEAYQFTSWLYVNGFVPLPEKTEKELMEFLLIQHWVEIGVRRKKAQLFDYP
jgi:hypothetical protein